MLNKLSLKSMLTSMLAISILILGGYDLIAQPVDGEFLNEGGTYRAGNTANKKGGIIRMKGAAGSDGTFTGIGLSANATTADGRISGTVIWNKDGDQHVQPLYYTNLGVAEPRNAVTGSDHKRFFGGATDEHYYVSGDFMRYGNTLRATPLTDAKAIDFRKGVAIPPTTALPIIDHTCFSHFHYDGSAAQMALGTILNAAGEQDNYYAYLYSNNPISVLLASVTYAEVVKVVSGPFIFTSGTPLHIAYSDIRKCTNTPDDTTTIDTIDVGDCNDPAWVAAHKVNFPDYDPTIACPPDPCPTSDPNYPCGRDTADPCGEAALYAGGGITIEIKGGITYPGDSDGFVVPFCFYAGDACWMGSRSSVPAGNVEPTRVIYRNSAPGIYPGWYGILEIASDVTKDMNILNNSNVYIKGKRFYALDHYGNNNLITGNNRVVFTDACAAPTYAACGEVEGWIYRSESYVDTFYTYHNSVTKLALNEIPYDNPTDKNQWFGLLSIPMINAGADLYVGKDTRSKAMESPDPSLYGYINRIWQVDFATGNPNAKISKMSLGHIEDEIDPVLAANWDMLRTYEAWDATKYPVILSGEDGNTWDPQGDTPPTGTGACNYFTMDQTKPIKLTTDGSTPPDPEEGDADDIYPGSQIVFGNIPTVIKSARNGRWSNPATWVGGSTPTSGDSVLIQHLVYTGLYSPTYTDLLGQGAFSRNEHDLPGVVNKVTGEVVLAKYVNIFSETAILALKATVDPSKDRFNPGGLAGVIIGNSDVAGHHPDNKKDPEGTAMNFDSVLVFATIENNNSAGIEFRATPLTIADLNTVPNLTTFPISGLYIMGGAGTGQTDAIPIAGTYRYWNKGRFINDGIFDVGK